MKTRAPLRVSFSGGGTDLEPYASEYGGAVLASAIKYYAKAEYPVENMGQSELEMTILDNLTDGTEGIKITNGAPPMAGLGGSASCFVAGLKAVRPDMSKENLAIMAYHLERNVMKVAGGKQDQYCAAYGGMLFMEFTDRGTSIEEIEIPIGLARTLVLVYMGERTMAGEDVIKDQMKLFNKRSFQLQKEIAYEMKDERKNLLEFGLLLDEAWRIKRSFTPLISNDKINEFYANTLTWGAIGGKLTGAGGGGYIMLMEHPSHYGRLRQNLTDRHIPYLDVYFDDEGVTVI